MKSRSLKVYKYKHSPEVGQREKYACIYKDFVVS